jgi:hypothetical protein
MPVKDYTEAAWVELGAADSVVPPQQSRAVAASLLERVTYGVRRLSGRRQRLFVSSATSLSCAFVLRQLAGRLVDASLSGLHCLGVLDREHKPQLVAVGQRVEGSPGIRVAVERVGEIGGRLLGPRPATTSAGTSIPYIALASWRFSQIARSGSLAMGPAVPPASSTPRMNR